MLLTVVLCCIVFLVWWWSRPRHRSPPTYPGALPIIGHAHHFIGDRKHLYCIFRNISNYCLENGDVLNIWIGPVPCYFLTDPDDMLQVANSCYNKPYIYSMADRLVHNGLVTSEASTWKTHRKLLNPAFNQQVINTYVDEMNVQSRHLVSLLAAEVGKALFDVRPYFVKHTLKTVSHTSLCLNVQDEAVINEDYVEILEKYIHLCCERFQNLLLHPSFIYKWTALKRKEDEMIQKMQVIMDPLLKKRKSELKSMKASGALDDSTHGKTEPLLNKLLVLAEEKGVFTDEDIKEHFHTFVVGTFDTTSSVLTNILIMIGSHQYVQERLFNELQEVLLHKNEDITKEDLSKLIYLDAVIKETMRYNSIIPIVARLIDTDIKLKNYTLPAGSIGVLSLYGCNRHPMWGADANTFRPERWLDPTTVPDNPNAFSAFSLGKRNCIGKLYGMMIMKITLAHILRRYHVTSDLSNLEFEFEIVIKPAAGHPISLKLRT